MNFNYSGILYFNYKSFQRHIAENLIESICKYSPRKIMKYGFHEPVNKTWSIKKMKIATQILSNYPEYFSGDFYLSDNKSTLFQINYKVGNPVKIYIYSMFSNNDSMSTDLNKFISDFSRIEEFVYGFIASNETLRTQNFSSRKDIGENISESYEGLSLKYGIPGIYELNYFSKYFVKENIMNIASDFFLQENGYIFQVNENQLSDIVNYKKELNINIFFDSDKKNQLVPLNLISFQETNNYVIPQYVNRKLSDIEKITTSLEIIQPIDLGDLVEFENQILNIFSDINTEEKYLELISYSGNLLRNYYLKLFKNDRVQLKNSFIQVSVHEDQYYINTYNIIALLIEDDLSLLDMENYIKMKFNF